MWKQVRVVILFFGLFLYASVHSSYAITLSEALTSFYSNVANQNNKTCVSDYQNFVRNSGTIKNSCLNYYLIDAGKVSGQIYGIDSPPEQYLSSFFSDFEKLFNIDDNQIFRILSDMGDGGINFCDNLFILEAGKSSYATDNNIACRHLLEEKNNYVKDVAKPDLNFINDANDSAWQNPINTTKLSELNMLQIANDVCGKGVQCSPECINKIFNKLADGIEKNPSKFIDEKGFVMGMYKPLTNSENMELYVPGLYEKDTKDYDDYKLILGKQDGDTEKNGLLNKIRETYNKVKTAADAQEKSDFYLNYGKTTSQSFMDYMVYKFFIKTSTETTNGITSNGLDCDPKKIIENSDKYRNSLKKLCNNLMGGYCGTDINVSTVQQYTCIGLADLNEGGSVISQNAKVDFDKIQQKLSCGYPGKKCCTFTKENEANNKANYCRDLVCKNDAYKTTTMCTTLKNDLDIIGGDANKAVNNLLSGINDNNIGQFVACKNGFPYVNKAIEKDIHGNTVKNNVDVYYPLPINSLGIPYFADDNEKASCMCGSDLFFAKCNNFLGSNRIIAENNGLSNDKKLSDTTIKWLKDGSFQNILLKKYYQNVQTQAVVNDEIIDTRRRKEYLENNMLNYNLLVNFARDALNISYETKTLDSISQDSNKISTLIDRVSPEYTQCMSCSAKGGVYSALGCIEGSAKDIFANIMRIGLGLAGLFMLGNIIFSAIQIQTSAGNTKVLDAAKQKITSAVYGILMITFAIVIMQIIGVDILGFNYIFTRN